MLERDQVSPELAALYDVLLKQRGVVPNMFKTVANHPNLALTFAAFLKSLLSDGTLPRGREALLADAIGTVAGAALGTSTVTAYIESGAGVAAGGRTGLASVVTAALFLLSLFFHPLVQTIGGGYQSGATMLYPIIAHSSVTTAIRTKLCIMVPRTFFRRTRPL